MLDEVVEDAGRQRLAAYYLYGALLAGLIGTDDLAPGRWSPELAEPMGRLGLTRFAPRTGQGLDAQLTGAQRATWRSPVRQQQFARLLVELQLTKDGHLAGARRSQRALGTGGTAPRGHAAWHRDRYDRQRGSI